MTWLVPTPGLVWALMIAAVVALIVWRSRRASLSVDHMLPALVAGTFSADLDLDGNGERDARLNGAIRPPPSNRGACSDGMHEHDVCVFEWMVTDQATLDSIASGTNSAVHLGYRLPPDPRPAHRYTIVDRETHVV